MTFKQIFRETQRAFSQLLFVKLLSGQDWYCFCIIADMKNIRILQIICLLGALSIIEIQTLCAAELLKINRANSKDIVQLYFAFDKAPKAKTAGNNRRLDLIFESTQIAPGFNFFDADDNIVKILPHQEKDNQIITFYFRYKPQDYKLTPLDDKTIVLEILLGNEYSSSYQKLAERLKGLTVIDRSALDLSNPYLASPYSGDWYSFFAHYESPVSISVPVHFTLPPFPLIAMLPPGGKENPVVLGETISKLAATSQWEQISAELLNLLATPKPVEQQKLLALTYGESMVRKGDFSGAYTQLYLLKETYPDELLGSFSSFLLTYLKAVYQDPYLANAEVDDLVSAIGNKLELSPYLYLLRTDLALAAKDFKKLNLLLQEDNIGLPPEVKQIIDVREADYWHAINQTVKAYAAYRLVSNSPTIYSLPNSLNAFCETQYSQNKFAEAAQCYKTLSSKVTEKKTLGLVRFRENMSLLKTGDPEQLIDDFGQIENAFPDTEAGWRGALKRVDLLLLKDHSRLESFMKVYEDISRDSYLRSIKEEALFKVSICEALLGHADKAIANTQKLLREFQSGDVRNSAQALLIELLPGEIKRLVKEHKYVDALVLAKQNRVLFQNNWINPRFLIDIAAAYQRIGIYDEAHRLYLYLIETMPVDEREQFYLPMIQATYDHANFPLVSEYAVQYFYNYPNGKDKDQIFILRIKALLAEERLAEAQALLPEKLSDNEELLRLAASIFFRSENFKRSCDVLSQLENLPAGLNNEETFMLAESLYRTEDFTAAKEEFTKVTPENPFYEQSLYRLAEIARKNSDENTALSFFRKIAEEGKNSIWKSYAERELQIAKAQEATNKLL